MEIDLEVAYSRELEERDRLRSSAGISIGVLTVLGGMLGTMLQTSQVGNRGPLFVVFAAGFGSSMLAFISAFAWLALTFRGHSYQAVPTPFEFKKYKADQDAWCERNNRELAESTKTVDAYVETCYVSAIHANAHLNWRRNELLFRFNVSSAACALLAMVAFVPFALAARDANETKHVGILISPKGVSNMTEDTPTGPPPAAQPAAPAPAAPAPPAPAQTADPQPAPPPMHQFRGGREFSIPPDVINLNKK